MKATSKLIVIEAPLPVRAVDQPAAIRMDLHMLALFEGGRERTLTQYGALFDSAGLGLLRIIPTQLSGLAIIEAGKKF
jgi:hypothetical protein